MGSYGHRFRSGELLFSSARRLSRVISLPRMLLWLALSVPALMMIMGLLDASGTSAKDLLHPSGEMSVRLMILAMLPGPLVEFFGPNRFLRGWLLIRRSLGVAAFAYAMLHLLFYILDAQLLAAILRELAQPAIWTGWLALALLAVPASISFDHAVRRLGRRWRKLQRLVYLAFIFTILHWFLLDEAWLPAIVHLGSLAIAWCLRLAAQQGYGVRSNATG